MPRDSRTIVEFSVLYRETFSLEFLYKSIRDWLINEGYVTDGGGSNGDRWMESLMVERTSGSGAKDYWIWWRTGKQVNPYFKWLLNIDYHTLGLLTTEMMHEGTKIKVNKGEVEVFIKATLIVDPDELWDKHFLLKNKQFQKMYKTRFYKREIEEQETLLYKDAYRLQGAIKQFLELKGWLHEYSGEAFHPMKGA
ncbi:hypothetical protein HY772_01890 [Candidatus Woesearchaeota archaeon]|nr:hypothetical protein [Candidatus Woesearchaeota archaeon]